MSGKPLDTPFRKTRPRTTNKYPEGATCSVDGCVEKAYSIGFCNIHYYRFHKSGDVGPAQRLKKPWGSGYLNSGGYRVITKRGHPNARPDGSVFERPLLRHETVHHINGQKDDNRIENLQLWSSAQPPGQRVSDKIEYAKEILSTYAPNLLANAENFFIGEY